MQADFGEGVTRHGDRYAAALLLHAAASFSSRSRSRWPASLHSRSACRPACILRRRRLFQVTWLTGKTWSYDAENFEDAKASWGRGRRQKRRQGSARAAQLAAGQGPSRCSPQLAARLTCAAALPPCPCPCIPQETATPLKDGWGITSDGTHLIVGDSSEVLTWVDPATMQAVRQVTVTGGPGGTLDAGAGAGGAARRCAGASTQVGS